MKEKAKQKEILRQIPSVDKILNWPELNEYLQTIEHTHLTSIIRYKIDDFRQNLITGKKLNLHHLKQSIIQEIGELINPYFCYAINAIGIVLHTGLGRAPFSQGIDDIVYIVSKGYSRLQIDEQGRRADRYKKINQLLQILTGAEAGFFVNNNAAATLLILNTIAKGKEVIVSRGQLIEIGGSFRIPEIMAQSGAIMREVGTTNRTHLRDYEGAINDETAALLRVHQSNYRISGFTKEVPLHELVELGKKYKIPVIDDLGSGALIDFSKYGLPKEPMVQESIETGADVVCFSGDKLIAGPQSGIIVGKKEYIEKMKKNPLTRALRCDKLTNAVLEATLQLLLMKEEILMKKHGVFNILLKPLVDIKTQAKKCAHMLHKYSTKMDISVKEAVSEIGGGSLSTEQLPTFVVALKPKTMKVDDLARSLRQYHIPIFGRVSEDTLLLDFRTVLKNEEKIIAEAFDEILKNK
ncbi:MAG: L-seryl-tRNA(Sec) selenium transferase [candidate division WOR-3 bacterium]|nr:MAG: L-seryl-tRNA(Sec) selenium transferase [candidate division WOR-3 bacterium]